MDRDKLHSLSRSVSLLCQALDSYERAGLWDMKNELPLQVLFQYELANFAFYLAAVDNVIRDEEVGTFSQVLGLSLSHQEILDAIEKNKLSDEKFTNHVPQIFVELKRIADFQKAEGEYDGCLEIFLQVFEAVGMATLESDGEVTEEEKEKMRAYLNMLGEYIAQ